MTATDTPSETEDVLAGITPQTTKAEFSTRLERAAGIITGLRSKHIKRTREIEERVRAKWGGQQTTTPLLQIIVQGTEDELRTAAEFIADLDDVAPHMLQRLAVGVDALLPKAKGGA